MKQSRSGQSMDKPLYLLVTVSSLNQYTFIGARFAIILYAVHLQATATTIGVLLALMGLGGALVSVAAGRWIDRAGTRNPMLVCCLGMAVGVAAPVISGSLAGFLIVSTLVGIFYNCYYVAWQVLLGIYGGDRVRNFSLAGLGQSAGSFIAPLLTGLAIDELGFAIAFATLALLPLVPALVVALGKLPMQPPQAPEHKSAPKENALNLLWDPRLKSIYVYATTGFATWQTLLFLLPLYGVELGLSSFHNGLMVSSLPVAAMFSRLLIPAFSRRLEPWQILMGSLAMSALGLALLPLLHSLVLIIVAAFWLGLGLGAFNPMSQALLYEAAPSERVGEALSLCVVMANVTVTVVPLVFGGVSAALGMGPVFWLLAVGLSGCCYAGRGRFARGGAATLSS